MVLVSVKTQVQCCESDLACYLSGVKMDKLANFFSAFDLNPKREDPRFQIVRLQQLCQENVEGFMGQLMIILATQAQITSTRDPEKKRGIQENLKYTLAQNGRGPGFRLALTWEDSIPGAKNKDTKKMRTVINALSAKMSQASLKQIVATLVQLYSPTTPEVHASLPNLSQLRQIRDASIKTFEETLQEWRVWSPCFKYAHAKLWIEARTSWNRESIDGEPHHHAVDYHLADADQQDCTSPSIHLFTSPSASAAPNRYFCTTPAATTN